MYIYNYGRWAVLQTRSDTSVYLKIVEVKIDDGLSEDDIKHLVIQNYPNCRRLSTFFNNRIETNIEINVHDYMNFMLKNGVITNIISEKDIILAITNKFKTIYRWYDLNKEDVRRSASALGISLT